MLHTLSLETDQEDFHNITKSIKQAVKNSGVKHGLCVIYCPHTTAGITVNENADPDVVHDMLLGLRRAYPDNAAFQHFEGNSTAHLKASAIGSSVTLIIEDGALVLGTWQGVYFCEFDGPRNRKYHIKIVNG